MNPTTLDIYLPLKINSPQSNGGANRLNSPENWYAEPFTKRTACKTPGQCGGDCDCGCPYNTMSDLERLPLMENIAQIFPNEWLAFIISPAEDDEMEPTRGKLVAHSFHPDEVHDAVNTVLWNQHIYVYFNGDFETLKASYGPEWDSQPATAGQLAFSGPKQAPVSSTVAEIAASEPLPGGVVDLIYSALDHLYRLPNLNEAIRRLRLARVRAAQDELLRPILDSALDQLEGPLPRVNEVVWFLEEALEELITEE